jgi:hypothetical protein
LKGVVELHGIQDVHPLAADEQIIWTFKPIHIGKEDLYFAIIVKAGKQL